MIRQLIKTARERIAAQIPAPMAAPETSLQRHRRRRLIGLLAAMAGVTLMAPSLILISRIGTALLWLGLALTTLVQGTTWLATKLHADAEWLDAYIQAPRDEVGEP